jgi:hypothetical protein
VDSTRHHRMAGLAWVLVIAICTSSGGQVIYVDDDAPAGGNGSSWSDACRFLQDALAQATGATQPVEIHVAQGVYRPDQGTGLTPGDQGAAFQLLKGVSLQGGYAGFASADPNARDVQLYETVLSGDLQGNDSKEPPTRNDDSRGKDNSCRLVVARTIDESAVLDGFTITAAGAPGGPCGYEYGGQAGVAIDAGGLRIQACHFRASHAPAVFAQAGGAPVLNGCTFDAGEEMVTLGDSVLSDCLFSGGGLYDYGAKLSLSNCTFDAGAAACRAGGSLTLTGCIFRNSRDFALGLWDHSTAVLADCLFERNGEGVPGRAISSQGRSDLTLEDCRFVENNGGGIESSGGCVSLTRCSFVKNTAQGTAAVDVFSGRVILCDCEFLGNSSTWDGSAVYVTGDLLKATGCVFAGNRNLQQVTAGALYSHTTVLLLSNCTFVGNHGAPHAIQCRKNSLTGRAELTHSIVWDGPSPFTPFSPVPSPLSVTCSDVQGGYPGEGNIDADPCFVNPGYWADPNDPNIALGPEDANAVWMAGDYHLKSQAGHWGRGAETWVCDEVTSPCIDAGDPNAPVGQEPFPNGAALNLGAYGGTAEASRSYFGGPVCETQIPGDLNGDCLVDATDAHILAAHWPWQQAEQVNTAPTVLLSSPQDGADVFYPTPVTLYVEATDTDGYVAAVTVLARNTANGDTTTFINIASSGRTWEWRWWQTTYVPFDSVFEIWAEAMDDDGAVTVSGRIKVTLHATN